MSDVEVAIEAKLTGQTAFEEAKLAVARIKEAIESFRTAEASGLPTDRAMQEAISGIAERAIAAGATTSEMTKQMTDARQALTHYTEAVAAGIPVDEVQIAVLNDVAEEYRQVARDSGEAAAAQDAAAASTAAAGAVSLGSISGWLAWGSAIAITLGVLAPFILLIGSAAVILTAFALAGAGTLALLGGLAFGFGAIGAAIIALGVAADSGTSAGRAGSFTTLIEQIKTLTAHFEEAARPIAYMVFQFISGLLPAVRTVGDELFKWFGDRLPGVLSAISGILKDLMPSFQSFAQFVGSTMDKVFGQASIGPGGTIKPLAASFEDGVRLMIAATEGLITNLSNLSQWFLERLPAYGPVVQQIFGWLGSAVLWVAQKFGDFADWLQANWPAITNLVSIAVDQMRIAWDKWAPIIGPLIERILPTLGQLLLAVALNSGSLVPVVLVLAAAFLIISGMILIAAGAVEALINWVFALGDAWSITTFNIIEDVRGILNALNQLPGVNIPLPQLPGQGGSALGPRGRTGGAIAGATGFEGTVFGPTLFMAGEGGSPEDVSIRPQGGNGGGPTIHIHIGSFYGDGPALDRLSMDLAQRLSMVTGR